MTETRFSYRATGEADTERLGRAIAESLTEGAVIALNGVLGAGKTRLVQGIAAACGVDPRDVVSPTFVLVHEYHGKRPIYHIDAYRLRDSDEFLQMGADEYFEGRNLVLIEWAQRVADCLPDERIEITIDILPDDTRAFEINAVGRVHQGVVESLRRRFSES
jgi:tRNA threonylcarbamoyladenosine biosynthesis protein TsaE